MQLLLIKNLVTGPPFTPACAEGVALIIQYNTNKYNTCVIKLYTFSTGLFFYINATLKMASKLSRVSEGGGAAST